MLYPTNRNHPMPEASSEVIDGIVMIVTTYGLKVVGAIAILIVGWIAAGWARRFVINALSKSDRVDKMLHGFFGRPRRRSI